MEMTPLKLCLAVVLSLCFIGVLIWGLIELSQLGNSKETSQDPGIFDPKSLTSCSVAMKILSSPRSTKQWIYPHGNSTRLEVLCDFKTDGGRWTVIQKRTSGPRNDFFGTWTEYSKGFGSLDRNFWLGLENIHALRKNGDQELRIELEDFKGNKAYAKYSSFSISDASDFYRLSIGGFSGSSTAGDSMTNSSRWHGFILNGMRFSTTDKDNDLKRNVSCAEFIGGSGWWFNRCSSANLNGLYVKNPKKGYGLFWKSWQGYKSLAKTEMKIRVRTFKAESESE